MADKFITGKFDPKGLMSGLGATLPAYGTLLGGHMGGMNAEDRGGAIGGAIGGTIGSVAESFIPIPGIGAMVGQVGALAGSLIAKGKGRREAAAENAALSGRTYGAFNEQINVDPYGAGNSAYMAEEGGMPMGLSMFMLNTQLPVKATVNPLDAKLMVDHGLPPSPMEDEIEMMADGGIHIKKKNRGKFTAWAKAHNMSVQQAASSILKNKGKHSSTLVKRANFARNASKWKKEEGGMIMPDLNMDVNDPKFGSMFYNDSNSESANSMALGGLTGFGGDDPTKPVPVYPNQAAVNAANAEAKRQAASFVARNPENVMTARNPEDTYVAKRPGDPVVRYYDQNNRDITDVPAITTPLANTLPRGVTAADIKQAEGKYWYENNLGHIVELDPNYVRSQQRLAPKVEQDAVVASRRKFKKGGYVDDPTPKQLQDIRNWMNTGTKGVQTAKPGTGKVVGPTNVITATNTPEYRKSWMDAKYGDQRKAEAAEKARVLAERKNADEVRQYTIDGKPEEGAPDFTFPDGTKKKYDQMTFKEKAYVTGRNMAGWQNDNWTDWVNPAAWVGALGEGIGTMGYEADRQNSIMPYIKGIGMPVAAGALGSIGARTRGEFVNNLVNPLAGVIGSPQEFKSLYNTITAKMKNNPAAVLTSEEQQLLRNVRNIGTIYPKAGIGGDERLKILQNIDKRSANLTDEQLRGLTGMDKGELKELISATEHIQSRQAKIPGAITADDFDDHIVRAYQQLSATEQRERMRTLFRQIEAQGTPLNPANQLPPPPSEIHLPNEDVPFLPNDVVTPSSQVQSHSDAAIDEMNRYREYADASYFNPPTPTLNNLDGPSMRIDDLNSRVRNSIINSPGVMTDYIRKFGKKGSLASRLKNKINDHGFMNRESMSPSAVELQHSLFSHTDSNPAAIMFNNYNKVKSANKGESFFPASSLSTDSAPMSFAMIKKAVNDDLVNVGYHGMQSANRSGFPTRAGVNTDIVLRELNATINGINSKLKKKIPLASVDEYGDIYHPILSVTRKRKGGIIDNNLKADDMYTIHEGEIPDGYTRMADGRLMKTSPMQMKKGGRAKRNNYYAEGGMPGEEQLYDPAMEQQQAAPEQAAVPQMDTVNIQYGELAVDPKTGEILKKFSNKARYSKHADSPLKEPAGNFVTLPTHVVIIPAKLAQGYEHGNKLTRSTMLRQILKDQMKREQTGQQEFTPAPGADVVPQAALGYYDDPTPKLFAPGSLGARQAARMRAAAAQNIGQPTPFIPPAGGGGGGDLIIDPLGEGTPRFPSTAQPVGGGATWDAGLGNVDAGNGAVADDGVVDNRSSWLNAVLGSQFLPAASQFAESFRGNPNLKLHTNRRFGDARSYIGQMPTDVNSDAAKGALGRAQRTMARQYGNFRRADVAGDMATSWGNLIDRTGEIEGQEYAAEQQAMGAKAQALGQLAISQGADQQGAEREYDLAKEQDAAANRNMRYNALSESTTRFSKNFMDNEKLRVANELATFYRVNPQMKKMIEDNPHLGETIRLMFADALSSGAAPYMPYNPNTKTTG